MNISDRTGLYLNSIWHPQLYKSYSSMNSKSSYKNDVIRIAILITSITPLLFCSSYRYTSTITEMKQGLSTFCKPISYIRKVSPRGQQFDSRSSKKISDLLKGDLKKEFGAIRFITADYATRMAIADLFAKIEKKRDLEEISLPPRLTQFRKKVKDRFTGIVYIKGLHSSKDTNFSVDAVSTASMIAGYEIYFLYFAVIDTKMQKVVYYDRHVKDKSPLDSKSVLKDFHEIVENYQKIKAVSN